MTTPCEIERDDEPIDGDPIAAWYAPAIEPDDLRRLMRRSDAPALLRFGGWLLLCAASGYAVTATYNSYWLIPSEFTYGAVLSFAYAISHECSHGTPFRTRWLNEAVFWITSAIFMEEAVYRRYAHAEHHTHTWFNGFDPQKPYGIPLTLRQYLRETVSPLFYLDSAKRLTRHALGRFNPDERRYLPPSERSRVRVGSGVLLSLYTALLLWGVLAPSPWPFLLYFVPRWFGGCLINLYINTQHMYMAEDLRDHRMTTRSIRCTPLERWLYWNMNWHIEHHLYPVVPFHALPRLSRQIAAQLPVPARSVWHANAQILCAIRRGRADPTYHLGGARGGPAPASGQASGEHCGAPPRPVSGSPQRRQAAGE